MTIINRQQYMNELSRLLTFMFKEDRSEIIKQYNEMLDNAEDEEEMLKSFGSPTRLAVTISRSYNRDEMKLSTQADSKDGTGAETIKLKPVIPAAQPAAAEAKAEPVKAVETADDAYIDIIEEIRREKAAEEGVEYAPIFFKEEPAAEEAAPEEEPVEEEPTEQEAPAEEEAEAEETSEAAEEVSAEEAEEAPAPAQEPEEETEAVEEPVSETVEEASEDAAETEETEEEAPEEETVEEAADDAEEAEEAAPAEEKLEVQEFVLAKPDEIFAELEAAKAPEVRTEKKTRVFALILYLIAAIPVGLVAALAMLGIELGLLGAGFVILRAGFELLSFTFSGMQVFADIFICLGVTLGVFAVGILLLWLAIWLLIESIPALYRGLVKLGKKLCVKEVEIDG